MSYARESRLEESMTLEGEMGEIPRTTVESIHAGRNMNIKHVFLPTRDETRHDVSQYPFKSKIPKEPISSESRPRSELSTNSG